MTRRHSPFDVNLAAAETIMRRMPTLWWGMMAPSPAAHAEITRMVIEKQAAFLEGVFALQMEFIRQMMSPVLVARRPLQAAEHLARAATAPAARRVKANARRLRRS